MRSKWANIVLFLNRPNFPFTRLSLHISAPPIPPSPALYLIIFVRPKCYRGWIIHPGTESEKRAGNFVNRVTGEWCLTHLHYNVWPWKQKLIELNLLALFQTNWKREYNVVKIKSTSCALSAALYSESDNCLTRKSSWEFRNVSSWHVLSLPLMKEMWQYFCLVCNAEGATEARSNAEHTSHKSNAEKTYSIVRFLCAKHQLKL